MFAIQKECVCENHQPTGLILLKTLSLTLGNQSLTGPQGEQPIQFARD